MLKSKALLLTQGMHGMISQVEGLSKTLGFKFKHETIRLKNIWNLIPPKFTPISSTVKACITDLTRGCSLRKRSQLLRIPSGFSVL